MYDVFAELRKRFFDLCVSENILGESVRVSARVLSTEEAIGDPEADDFPQDLKIKPGPEFKSIIILFFTVFGIVATHQKSAPQSEFQVGFGAV